MKQQFFIILPLEFLMTSVGALMSFSSTFIPAIEAKGISTSEIAWIASIVILTQTISCAFVGALTLVLGRKGAMMAAVIPMLAGWALLVFGPENVGFFVTLRALSGLGAGVIGGLMAPYVAEISRPELRGAFVATGSLLLHVGSLFVNVLGAFLPWKSVAVICAVLPLINLITLFFIPESPVWLLSKGKTALAHCAIRRLGRDEADWSAMLKTSEPKSHRANPMALITDKRHRTPLIILITVLMAQAWSGVGAVMFFGVTLLESTGSIVNAFYANVFLSGLRILGAFVSIFIMKSGISKRLFFSSCCAVSGISLIVLGLNIGLNYSPWISSVCLLVFIMTFGVSAAPPWIWMGEFFADETRSLANGVCAAVSSASFFAATLTFPYMTESDFFGLKGTFWFYAGANLFNAVFTYCVIPETANEALHELQDLFSGRFWPRKSRKSYTVNP